MTKEVHAILMTPEGERLLSQDDVVAECHFSRVTLNKKRKRGRFPDPVTVKGRAFWPQSVIERFNASRNGLVRQMPNTPALPDSLLQSILRGDDTDSTDNS